MSSRKHGREPTGHTPRRGLDAKLGRHEGQVGKRSSARVKSRNNETTPPSPKAVPTNKNHSATSVAALSLQDVPTIQRSTQLCHIVPQPAPHLYTSRSIEVTCFSFKLTPNPKYVLQWSLICAKCKKWLDSVLQNDITKLSTVKRSSRSQITYGCEKPWDPKWQTHRMQRKRDTYNNFHAFFCCNAKATVATNLPVQSSSSSSDKDSTSNGNNTPNDPPLISNNHTTSPPLRTSVPEPQPQQDESAEEVANEDTELPSPALLIDEKGIIDKEAAAHLQSALERRDLSQQPCEDHELSLLQSKCQRRSGKGYW